MSTLEDIYGPKCASDNQFAAKARFLQSWYRKHILNVDEFGPGPDETSETRFGNILTGGEISGKNFLMPEIFRYAQFRTQFLKCGETIKEYRLFNNMLSSQPMCFNLFFPLKALFENDHQRAVRILKACFPSLKIDKIVSLEIEYLPYPVKEYLDDRTAFDAMLIYKNESCERNILAIETKYVEKLGTNSSSRLEKQIELVNESILFNDAGKAQAVKGFDQLGRNFLLAEKYRIEYRLDKAYAVVISPEENNSSIKEIENFHELMDHEFHCRLFNTSLENITRSIKDSAPRNMISWMDEFNRRYLGFSECDSLFNSYMNQ